MNRTMDQEQLSAVWLAPPGAGNTLVECLPRKRRVAPRGLLHNNFAQWWKQSNPYAVEHHVRAMERPRSCKQEAPSKPSLL